MNGNLIFDKLNDGTYRKSFNSEQSPVYADDL